MNLKNFKIFRWLVILSTCALVFLYTIIYWNTTKEVIKYSFWISEVAAFIIHYFPMYFCALLFHRQLKTSATFGLLIFIQDWILLGVGTDYNKIQGEYAISLAYQLTIFGLLLVLQYLRIRRFKQNLIH